MTVLEWAEQEVKIACEKEKPGKKEDEFDYGCACYESALKAFESLIKDGHTGYSMSVTKNILNALIDGKALTPIEDRDDIWMFSFTKEDGTKVYQCTRMSALFKEVHPDRATFYNDVNRVLEIVIEKDGHESIWYNGMCDQIVNELFPISMPYIPEEKPYKVYCEEFSTKKDDTISFLYLIKPNGDRLDVNRYFAETDDGYEEISSNEYLTRKDGVIRD